jgi:hypothetical protein
MGESEFAMDIGRVSEYRLSEVFQVALKKNEEL